jgi:hypothetical protein
LDSSNCTVDLTILGEVDQEITTVVGSSVHLVHDKTMSFEQCAARVDGTALADVSDPELRTAGRFRADATARD